MAEKDVEDSLGELTLEAAKMTTIDLATTDGDVLLTIGETRLRVSSVILSSASQVFKTMLGPVYLEGQDDRSAQNPKEIPLVDEDVSVMTRLCRLLHHQRDLPDSSRDPKSLKEDAEGLFDLAVLAEKYFCTESIQMTGGYLLFELGSRTKPTDMPISALLHLIAAAYILEDRRHFALFTRRLVLDHAITYSTVANHPALAMLPNLFLLLVEEQRKSAWFLLHDGLLNLATNICSTGVCRGSTTDQTFWRKFLDKLPSFRPRGPIFWPPNDRSVRFLLAETHHCGGDVPCQIKPSCGHSVSVGWIVTCDKLKELCDEVQRNAYGLCLDCLAGQGGASSECSHQLLERWVENDPFV